MKNALEPKGDRVIVRRHEQEEVTKGGILLPKGAAELPKMGTVIAVGPGRTTDDGQHLKPSVKPGDEVLFPAYAGETITLDTELFDEKQVIVMRDEEILARVVKASDLSDLQMMRAAMDAMPSILDTPSE